MDGEPDNPLTPTAAVPPFGADVSDASRAPVEPRSWAMPEAGVDRLGGGLPADLAGAPARPDAVTTPGASVAPDAVGWSSQGAPGGAEWSTGAVPAGPPPLPVALEPMTVSDLLDGAWAIMKGRPRTIFSITAMIIVPVQLLAAFFQRGAAQNFDATMMLGNTQTSTRGSSALGLGFLGLGVLGWALSSLSYFLLGGAIARLVSSWYAGTDLTAREAVVASLKKTHIYVAAFLLLLIPKAVSFAFCYIGAIFLIPLLMLTAPAIMIENLGPIAGIRRSWNLVSRRYWWCVWIWALSFVLEYVINAMLSSIPQLLAQFVPALAADFLVPAGAAFARLVTAPIVVGVCVLLYLDLRVRSEGLDLELEASDAFATRAR